MILLYIVGHYAVYFLIFVIVEMKQILNVLNKMKLGRMLNVFETHVQKDDFKEYL